MSTIKNQGGIFLKDFISMSIILENCEVIHVPEKYIVDIQIHDIKKEFRRFAVNSMSYSNYSEFILFSISSAIKNSDTSKSTLFPIDNEVSEGEYLLESLQHRDDIVGISINTTSHRIKDTYIKVNTDCECSDCQEYPNDLKARKNRALEYNREYFHCRGCDCDHCKEYTETLKHSDTIYFEWDGSSDYQNIWQQNFVNENGDVFITNYNPENISDKNKELLDNYLKSFNDIKDFDFKKRMYS